MQNKHPANGVFYLSLINMITKVNNRVREGNKFIEFSSRFIIHTRQSGVLFFAGKIYRKKADTDVHTLEIEADHELS